MDTFISFFSYFFCFSQKYAVIYLARYVKLLYYTDSDWVWRWCLICGKMVFIRYYKYSFKNLPAGKHLNYIENKTCIILLWTVFLAFSFSHMYVSRLLFCFFINQHENQDQNNTNVTSLSYFDNVRPSLFPSCYFPSCNFCSAT